jgi:hypothetical protein
MRGFFVFERVPINPDSYRGRVELFAVSFILLSLHKRMPLLSLSESSILFYLQNTLLIISQNKNCWHRCTAVRLYNHSSFLYTIIINQQPLNQFNQFLFRLHLLLLGLRKGHKKTRFERNGFFNQLRKSIMLQLQMEGLKRKICYLFSFGT